MERTGVQGGYENRERETESSPILKRALKDLKRRYDDINTYLSTRIAVGNDFGNMPPDVKWLAVNINLKAIALTTIVAMEVWGFAKPAWHFARKSGVQVIREVEDFMAIKDIDVCGAGGIPNPGARFCMAQNEKENMVSFVVPSKKQYGPHWQQESFEEQQGLARTLVRYKLPPDSIALKYNDKTNAWHVRVSLPHQNESYWLGNIQKYADVELSKLKLHSPMEESKSDRQPSKSVPNRAIRINLSQQKGSGKS